MVVVRNTDRKAHPDEKGTERAISALRDEQVFVLIARPIPMKRELKVCSI